jgi:hypothetical protein
MFLSLAVPYYPSPFKEGRAMAQTKRSHLALDLEKIAQATEMDPRTLNEYIEKDRVMHPLGVAPFVRVYQASMKLRCYYRYFICPVVLVNSPTGRGYKLVVKGPDEAPPREALGVQEVQDLLSNKQVEVKAPGRVGRPRGSGKGTKEKAVAKPSGKGKEKGKSAGKPPKGGTLC